MMALRFEILIPIIFSCFGCSSGKSASCGQFFKQFQKVEANHTIQNVVSSHDSEEPFQEALWNSTLLDSKVLANFQTVKTPSLVNLPPKALSRWIQTGLSPPLDLI